MDIKSKTVELENVLSYMTETLTREFPIEKVTPEYFIVAVLDKKKCNAYVLLSTMMNNQKLDDIKHIFIQHINDNIAPIVNAKATIGNELGEIISQADNERLIMNHPFIGSQHVILAMLNPVNNHERMMKAFQNMGVDYGVIYNKCMEINKKTEEAANKKMKNNNNILNLVKNDMINAKPNPIEMFTIDITKQAENGRYDDLIGREREMRSIIEVLARRKKNNAIILGKSGVGKTSLVYGLANAIVSGNVPDIMRGKRILQVNTAALISGTFLRGAFEERVKMLFDTIKLNDKYILFFDDIHTVLKSSTKDRDSDLSTMLPEILSNGEIKVIGTTTFKDYRNSIESNPMICRRFQKIMVEPTTQQETIEIINRNKCYYEEFHNVKYSDEAIKKSVILAERYITERCLPDSAIDIIDLCGAKINASFKNENIDELHRKLEEIEEKRQNASRLGNFDEVVPLLAQKNEIQEQISDIERDLSNKRYKYTELITEKDVYQTVSDITNIPINKITIDEKKQLAKIDEVLKQSVIGQDAAIDTICKAIKRNKLGLGNKNKPIASMLLVGQSGVGKTLVAKKIAEEVFGDSNALIRIDMSEYSEKNSVAKLTGAAPGYIGYDNGGQLTEAVKHKKYCVILLDEIEKADQDVYNLLLQLLDEGRLTDNTGFIVDFKNTIILMTSNVGTKKAQEFGVSIGFVNDSQANVESIITKEIKNKFAPEFINRLDSIVYFNNLTIDNLKDICRLELNKLVNRIGEIGYNIMYDQSVVDGIVDKCKTQLEYGARPIIRIIQDDVEDVITNEILSNDFEVGSVFMLSMTDSKVQMLKYEESVAN